MLWPVACEELAWLPLLLPVGDDASGTYLLHLEPGDVVSLEGPDAPSMLAAWVEAAKSWPWAEQVGVAHDAETAEALAPLFVGQVSLDERATLLFTGDPACCRKQRADRRLGDIRAQVMPPRASWSPPRGLRRTVRYHSATVSSRPCLRGRLAAIDEPRLIRVVAEETEAPSESTEKVGGVMALPRSRSGCRGADRSAAADLYATDRRAGRAVAH